MSALVQSAAEVCCGGLLVSTGDVCWCLLLVSAAGVCWCLLLRSAADCLLVAECSANTSLVNSQVELLFMSRIMPN